mgnify:CR=1 FL=1
MTPDEHQRERMRHWSRTYSTTDAVVSIDSSECADAALAAFDKRFPAPSAAAPVKPVASSVFAYDVKVIDVETYTADMAELETLRRTQAMHNSELASLRQKALLWDVVASGKVRLSFYADGYFSVDHGSDAFTGRYPTAGEAVEAAIAAGALK